MGALHYSNLRAFAKSPAHYRALLERPRSDSGPMRIGRLVHAIILGGDFVIFDGTRRGKAWDEFQAEHDGKDIYTASEHEDAGSVARAVLGHPEAMALLAGERELGLTWDLDGRPCAGRIDAVCGATVADLKTTADANPDRFVRHAIKMGYHAQLAWYADGLASAGRPRPTRHCLVAVETEFPHVITSLELTPGAVEAGRALYRSWLAQLADCERTGHWPGYVEGTIPFDVALPNGDGEEDAMEGLVISDISPVGAGAVDPLERLARLRQEQADLFDALKRERIDTLVRLASQCAALGPITRADLPDGILRRHRKVATKLAAAKRPRKAKAETAEQAA